MSIVFIQPKYEIVFILAIYDVLYNYCLQEIIDHQGNDTKLEMMVDSAFMQMRTHLSIDIPYTVLQFIFKSVFNDTKHHQKNHLGYTTFKIYPFLIIMNLVLDL